MPKSTDSESEGPRSWNVGLVALPESGAASLYGICEVLLAVGHEWKLLTGKDSAGPFFEPKLVSLSTEPFRGSKGTWIKPDLSFAEAGVPDIVCVPELVVAPSEGIAGRCAEACEWLRACHEAGAVVCSVCSGTLLIAEAGLLDDREATTHWAFAEAMKRRYPRIDIQGQRVLIATGPGERIITSGGWASWTDLSLYLISRFASEEQAKFIAKLFLLQWHSLGQQPYANLTLSLQHEDSVVASCQEWLALNYDEPNPVTTMVERTGLPERTIKRRFAKATGVSPLDYVHNLRIEEAKQMLESSETPIEEIAAEVGYQEPGFFRRLFKRRVGITPGAYRKAFGTTGLGRSRVVNPSLQTGSLSLVSRSEPPGLGESRRGSR
jgi:transcriptional regulator GlxA family with amidase domain